MTKLTLKGQQTGSSETFVFLYSALSILNMDGSLTPDEQGTVVTVLMQPIDSKN